MSALHYSSVTLAKAATLAERIESLQEKLNALFQGTNAVIKDQSTPKTRTTRSRRAPKRLPAAPKSTRTNRGTLSPAVVGILQKSGKPLKTAEIYEALLAQGYPFAFKEPKKILGIRLYKMAGVRRLGGGLFQAA
jgi:hypothetical protein